jgi:hypothetical protein
MHFKKNMNEKIVQPNDKSTRYLVSKSSEYRNDILRRKILKNLEVLDFPTRKLFS